MGTNWFTPKCGGTTDEEQAESENEKGRQVEVTGSEPIYPNVDSIETVEKNRLSRHLDMVSEDLQSPELAILDYDITVNRDVTRWGVPGSGVPVTVPGDTKTVEVTLEYEVEI